MKLTIVPARRSAAAALPVRFIQSDLSQVGTHEPANPEKLAWLIASYLTDGYNGPAISVLQRESDVLFESLQADGPVAVPPAGYGDLGVADGHNRLQALRILQWANLLALQEVPFQLVPARNSEVIRLGSTIPEQRPFALQDIVACFPKESSVITDCATCFEARLADGTWHRLQESQPDVRIPAEELVYRKELSRTQAVQEIASELVVAYLHRA